MTALTWPFLSLSSKGNPTAYAERQAVFNNNLKNIAALNAYAAEVSPTGYPTIALSATPFAHLVTQEFVDAYLKTDPSVGGGRTDDFSDSGRRRKERRRRLVHAASSPARRRRSLLAKMGGVPLTCAPLDTETTEIPYPFAHSPYKVDK
jgi:hypothetical protein